jgi:hypothetical protein
LAKLHGLLAHARFAGREIPEVNQVLVRTDWRGLKDRTLCWDHDTALMGGKRLLTEAYAGTAAVPWTELRGTYFTALRRVAVPLLALFNYTTPHAAELLTPALAWEALSLVERGLDLFDEP